MNQEKYHPGEQSWIRRFRIRLDPPRLGDNRADADRLLLGLKKTLRADRVSVGLRLLREIPRLLREGGYGVEVVVHEALGGRWRLMDVVAEEEDGPLYGLAVDLGTSTVVVRLVDLQSGEVKEEISFLNPQTEIGLDILTRIHHAARPGGLETLQGLVITRLDREILSLAQRHSIRTRDIAGMTVAGNTTMSHLFLGLDPHWVIREPYIPVANEFPIVTADELGLGMHPEAPVLVFPNAGSYFGGDLVAGILASGMTEREDLSLLVDIGTNAEIVAGNRDWLVACAGAAGPALEGGVAGMGMMAGPGVIDRVKIDPSSGEVRVMTIQDRPPVGICGSGLIDLVAQLYLAGMIDMRGKFVAEKCGERLREEDGVRSFLVVPARSSGSGEDLVLLQTDLDGLLRSKAAMYTILTTVSRMISVPTEEFSSFFVAGTFGSYIDPRSAIVIGMVPDLPIERYKPLGNTSLQGATEVLLSGRAREEIGRIRDKITYVELNVNQEFMNLFSAARFLPG
jgi:uncharacterized 2Fe-2S/4Fe-4S cluster protein (DUF4445 family)